MSPLWLRTPKPYLIEHSEELFSVKITGAGQYFKSRYWNILTKPLGHIVPTLTKDLKTLPNRAFWRNIFCQSRYFKWRYWNILSKPRGRDTCRPMRRRVEEWRTRPKRIGKFGNNTAELKCYCDYLFQLKDYQSGDHNKRLIHIWWLSQLIQSQFVLIGILIETKMPKL